MFKPSNDQFIIDNRSQLIYALTEAAALEHVLMCQYLFAGASLKTHVSELDQSPRRYHQIELIRYWKRKCFEIAREEMQHLSIAMNLLVAVGGSPTFERPNFPNTNLYYKEKLEDGTFRGLEMSLEKFSGPPDQPLRTIDRFIRFEQPHAPTLEVMLAIPKLNTYDSVGALYAAIRDAFGRIPNVILDKDDQYDPTDESGRPVRVMNRPNFSTVVRTVEEAQAMIDQIVRQGEGYPDVQNDPTAHFAIFQRIREEYKEELTLDPHFDPARNVVPNPTTRLHEYTGISSVIDETLDGGFQYELLQLFGGAYGMLLGWLGQLFSRGGKVKPPELRAIETVVFLPYMSEVISPLAELLTLVPVPCDSDKARLGPSFEVTTNDFLIPPLGVAMTLSFERLHELATLADKLTAQANHAQLTDVADQLGFVAKTIHLLNSELQSRVQYGWPPDQSSWEPKYSEQALDSFKYNFSKHAVLELSFEGVAQCRLATDPDGAGVRRGVTGNGFAIADEPDLDRIIRFQPQNTVPRSHCPNISVIVRSAALKQQAIEPWRDRGHPVTELVGATVDLLGEPKFEGRNHLVSEDGEPIDPFDIEVKTHTGVSLRRRALGIPINDMTPTERRGSGRYPTSVSVSEDSMLANLAVLQRLHANSNLESPFDYTTDRKERLKQDLNSFDDSNDPEGRYRAELTFRLRSLDEGLLASGKPDARTIRWTRYFFDAHYRHLVSGPVTASIGHLGDLFNILDGVDAPSWLVDYNLGYFDTDAMTMVVRGHLYIPVSLN